MRAVRLMQKALADLRLWFALVGAERRPSIHPQRVHDVMGALEAGLAEIGADQEGAGGERAIVEEAGGSAIAGEIVGQIQERLMRQGVALPTEIIVLVLAAEDAFRPR